jgi:hypothetical protein
MSIEFYLERIFADIHQRPSDKDVNLPYKAKMLTG